MSVIKTETIIEAPIELCFDMARDLFLHQKTVWKHTKERVQGGNPYGRLEAGDTVTFIATHFGIRQRLVSEVVAYERPLHFIDEMKKGAFKRLTHRHYFAERGASTVMTDILEFDAPFGLLGKLTDFLILNSYMTRFLSDRNTRLKTEIEEEYRPDFSDNSHHTLNLHV